MSKQVLALITGNELALQPTQLFRFSKLPAFFEQQQVNAQKWINALIEDNFAQNKSRVLKDETGFSVLGVAMQVCDLKANFFSDYRLEGYAELGLSNDIAGCREFLELEDAEEDKFNHYNSLLVLPEYYTFRDIGTFVQAHFKKQVVAHKLYFELMATKEELNLFNPDLCRGEETKGAIDVNIATWLKALRSGDYHQAQTALAQTLHHPQDIYIEYGVGYCCLGVADVVCKLYEESKETLMVTHEKLGLVTSQGDFNITTDQFEKLQKARGISTGFLVSCALAGLNDAYGWTFDMIADFVEAQFNIVTTTAGGK